MNHSKNIPLGIKIISIFLGLAALSSIVQGISVMMKVAAVTSLLANFSSNFPQLASQAPMLIGVIMILLGLAVGAIGFYLWKGKNWARWTLLVLSGLNILSGVASVIQKDYIAAVWLVLNIVMFSYLFWSKSIKQFFS